MRRDADYERRLMMALAAQKIRHATAKIKRLSARPTPSQPKGQNDE